MADWRLDEARNQFRFRDFNEWIKSSIERMENHRPMHEYVCECGDASCHEPIVLSPEEYEVVRSRSNRFAMAINHENPEVDEVLSETDRFALIAMLPGLRERMARESDPRLGARIAEEDA
jgi:hypothetical protein